jgi:hypothetical protein
MRPLCPYDPADYGRGPRRGGTAHYGKRLHLLFVQSKGHQGIRLASRRRPRRDLAEALRAGATIHRMAAWIGQADDPVLEKADDPALELI